MNTKRPTALLSALVLLVILGVGHLFIPFVPDAGKIPSPVVYGDVLLGLMSLIAAFGLWKEQGWGAILTLIIAALNIVSAAPGVVVAPNMGLRVVTAVYVLVSLLIIALVAFSSERKLSAHRTPVPQE